MLCNDWYSLFRILAAGSASYFLLVALVRIFGKRSLARMNTFDFIVTIALGSSLATSIPE